MSSTARNDAEQIGPDGVRDPVRRWWARIDRRDLARTAFVGITAAAVAALGAGRVAGALTAGISIMGLVIGCWSILVEAAHDLRRRQMSMELSMLLAIAAAGAIGAWVTALVIAMFVLVAEILENLCVDRGQDALVDLMAFLPSTVQVRHGAGVVRVPLSEVTPGQVVVISPGGRVPVDGTVMAGSSQLDQSRITGEAMPLDVSPGVSVYAGSVNHNGVLEVRAERIGSSSSYGQIIETVQAAQESRAPVQRLADRLAAWLVYLALAGAAITLLATRDVRASISVVIVAGACGVAAGTPLAVLAAIGRAARTGAFIKSGTHLERLARVDTVVFDKTGTLTTGILRVQQVRPEPGVDPLELVALAAGAERYSEHPIGRAIGDYATAEGIAVADATDSDYRPGEGVSATIGSRRITIGQPQARTA